MGAFKLTLPWGPTTVIEDGRETLSAAARLREVLAVTGHRDEEVQALERTSARCVFNPHVRDGRDAKLDPNRPCRTWMPAAMRSLCASATSPRWKWQRSSAVLAEGVRTGWQRVIIPSYRMRAGHPILIPCSFWLQIMNTTESLRTVLRSRDEFHRIPDRRYATILADLDTPDDYARACQPRLSRPAGENNMRMTQLFGRTLREPPADAEGAGYRLLLRGGLRARPGANGTRTCRGAARRRADRGRARPRRRARPAGATCECPPVEDTAALLGRSPAALAASEVQSYRQLPVRGAGRNVWRHALSQSRGGPLNAREAPACFVLHLDAGDSARRSRLRRTAARLPRPLRPVRARGLVVRDQTAARGQSRLPLPFRRRRSNGAGLRRMRLCGAREPLASLGRLPGPPKPQLPLEKIETPHTATIADLARLLGVPESRTAKAVFLMAAAEDGERFVFAVVRGDTDVSERKLRVALRRKTRGRAPPCDRCRNPRDRRHARLRVAHRAKEGLRRRRPARGPVA